MNAIPMIKRAYRRHGAEERAQWVRQYEHSGQSLREFCMENGLSQSTLCLWRRQLRSQGGESGPEAASFVELRVAPASASEGAVKIRLRSGVELEVLSGTDARWLALVVQALRPLES